MNVKKKLPVLIFAILLMLLILTYSTEVSQTVLQSLRLCGTSVIPALFPVFVAAKLLCSILTELPLSPRLQRVWERLFGVDAFSAFAFLLGLLGGYPLGAAVLTEASEKGVISRVDAERAMGFCNNSGPGFFLAAVGSTVLGSVSAGLLLYVIHLFSAVTVGLIFATAPPSSRESRQSHAVREPSSISLLQSIQDSCTSILHICALVIFFHVLLALLECVGLFDLLYLLPGRISGEDLKACIHGILELTGGIMALSGSPNAFVLCAFLMGWGGLCVHFQAKAHWQKAGLRPRKYYISKLIQGLFSACAAWTIQFVSLPFFMLGFLLFLIFLILLRFFRKGTGKQGKYAL